MSIACPACHMEFDEADIRHTLQDGFYRCPVCGKKFASPSAPPVSGVRRHRPVVYLLAMILLLGAWGVYLVAGTGKSGQQKAPPHHVVRNVPQVSSPPVSSPLPATAIVDQPPQAAPVSDPVPGPSPSPAENKLSLVGKIATDFHKNHTYTLEGDFVCLDMAIAVWNEMMTHGIEAKIMVGNVKEDVTWSYRTLVAESNHAWVLARVSPREEVAVETTSGGVIRKDMKDSSLYFKGIVFDSPAQVKEFDYLRKKIVVCREANEMVTDWNENIAGKQRVSAGVIERKAVTEERIKACERVMAALDGFKSRAVYY